MSCIPEVCSLTTKAIEENKDVRDDLKDGNGALNVQNGEDVDVLRSHVADPLTFKLSVFQNHQYDPYDMS